MLCVPTLKLVVLQLAVVSQITFWGANADLIPLIVLSDFVARGISPVNASGTVLAATRAGAADLALLRMRERINERIRRGEAPLGASREGLRELLTRTEPGPRVSSGPEPRERRRP